MQQKFFQVFRQAFSLLNLTLANFAGSSAARDSKHRIVLDDLMSAFEHEFHASHVAKSCPAAFHI